MITKFHAQGGRTYAVAASAILSTTFLTLVYIIVIAIAVPRGDLTPEFFTWLSIPIAGIAGVGTAMQVPKAAQRWKAGNPEDVERG
jgi:hypothetical protein